MTYLVVELHLDAGSDIEKAEKAEQYVDVAAGNLVLELAKSALGGRVEREQTCQSRKAVYAKEDSVRLQPKTETLGKLCEH